MYWLFDKEKQKKVREEMDKLVVSLSVVNHKPPHADQIFPFQGRKAINHAKTVIELLTKENEKICDPFVGSGSFAYAASFARRIVYANEYEPYTFKMAKLPYLMPSYEELNSAYNKLIDLVKDKINYYYRSRCVCGRQIVIDSLFYDRVPLAYTAIKNHERLGKNGQNITFRGEFKCPSCGETSKFFDSFDHLVMDEIENINFDFFDVKLIENSRINISKDFLFYKNFFPKRSQIVSKILWDEIDNLNSDDRSKEFLKATFLSLVPNMKYKDYRSKSQDLHCPTEKLRENNIFNLFKKQFKKREETLFDYSLNDYGEIIFENMDFREFLATITPKSIDLVITDPPWHDGSAYFERAQLYHPWLGYDLKKDKDRLDKEVIVTNSPERPNKRGFEQWWKDMDSLFHHAYNILDDSRYIVLYFRPIPAKEWIVNFNRLKLLARKNGFEPLLTIDLSNNDPSMRIQQSAHYAFSSDLILTFIKLSDEEKRYYFNDFDLDELGFRVAVDLQEQVAGTFTFQKWKKAVFNKCVSLKLYDLNLQKNSKYIDRCFDRVCEEILPGQFLPVATSPYSDEIFNVPYIERVSLYIPYVIEELLQDKNAFTFDQFLLKIAEFVENGTRGILEDILHDGEDSIYSLLNLYAEPLEGGKFFTKRPTPRIPNNIKNLLELTPYQFEAFVAHLLELEGYKNVVISGRSGDRGVDVRCNTQDGDLVIVQCKRYTKSKIGSTPIQRLHSFASTRGAKHMICITTTDFTPDGYDEARLTGVRTIERNELEKMVYKHKVFEK